MRGLRSSPTTRADAPGGLARDDPGPAADVEDPIAPADAGGVGEQHGGLREQRGHEAPFVEDRGIVGHLPCFLFGHGVYSLPECPGEPERRPSATA
jgi:hypothetical protein